MKKLLLIAALLFGCGTSKQAAEASARRWAQESGISVTGISCVGFTLDRARCSVHGKSATGGGTIVALQCDDEGCMIAERASDTTVIYAPSGR